MPNQTTDDKIDALALAIGRGFDEVHRKLDDIRGDVRESISRIDHLKLQTGGLSGRVEVLEDTIRVIKTKLEIR